MKTLNLRKGQRTKQRNRILVDLFRKFWDASNWKTEKLTVRLDWTIIFPIFRRDSLKKSGCDWRYVGKIIVQSNRTVSFSVFQFHDSLQAYLLAIRPPASRAAKAELQLLRKLSTTFKTRVLRGWASYYNTHCQFFWGSGCSIARYQNPGLQVNRSFHFSRIEMFFTVTVLCCFRLSELATEGKTENQIFANPGLA